MIDASARLIELTEYSPARFAPDRIPREVGERLWREYGNQIDVEFPSPKTGGEWELTCQGWVGYIPLTRDFHFALRPKILLSNLFRMLEYAYKLDIRFLEGLFGCESLEEFYEELAKILASRVLERGRKGLYRAYLPEVDQLPYIRGRMDLTNAVLKPWDTKVKCLYEDHTADNEDNQILAWTMLQVGRNGLCTARVLPTVQKAHRTLQALTSAVSCGPEMCTGRIYSRLNSDYQPLHALCRMFLEHSGPGYRGGDRNMLPFLVDMSRLYELFVAEWLNAHLPASVKLRRQERINIGETGTISFQIDLVLYDMTTAAPFCVLDTKYKKPGVPSPSDIAQVVTYAEAKGCTEAILVYPTTITLDVDESIGNIRIKSLPFSVSGNLEESGRVFLRSLPVPKAA
jgi:5-methylcytosine-specific restriction enzyme subunit McrC